MQMVGFLIAVSAVLSSGCSKSYFSLQQNSTQYLTLVIFVLQLWSLQECISQTEQVQRKHCYKLVPCIPSWLSQTARKCFLLLFFFPLRWSSSHFLHHFVSFPPSLSNKDNNDMSLHLQFREPIDLIMGHNELNLPLQL